MAKALGWANILRITVTVLMISICAKQILNWNISIRLQQGLRASPFRRFYNSSTMASAEPESQVQDQVESPAPARPQSQPPLELPELSPSDHKLFNRLAEQMDYYVGRDRDCFHIHKLTALQHNHFRATWNTLYKACENNRRPAGMSIRQFLRMGLDLCHHLETHHSIEERHIFPQLAVKMPLFRQKDHLLSQHAQIHVGLEGFEKYLTSCRDGERELRMEEMKQAMDTFGKVLWAHLDDEVQQLGAENMRKFWTKEDMIRMGNTW